ncbi:MAG TPA: DUF3501 family protein [Gammaproteobacteria bacterium]|nr:DUF3501 family protein [Gammaproteobacteria bacterium]
MTTQKLTRDDLYSLENYSEIRQQFRSEVMDLKMIRILRLGEHASLHFENRKIMQYQIQEMLRIERIFEADAIQEELDTYNPLISDGSNWKVTFMIEYEDEQERKIALEKLLGVEDRVWVQITGHDRVFAIADEDMERENDTKTSSVHFLRFELTLEMIASTRTGSEISAGIDHEHLREQISPVSEALHLSLLEDLS